MRVKSIFRFGSGGWGWGHGGGWGWGRGGGWGWGRWGK